MTRSTCSPTTSWIRLEARANAGVRSFAIRQPVNDPLHLMLDLEFDTAGRAEAFAHFLEQHVWSTPAASPGLAGTPQTRVPGLVVSAARVAAAPRPER
jgi:hypothetical protein